MLEYLLDQSTHDSLVESLRILERRELENKQLISEIKKILDFSIIVPKEENALNIGDVAQIVYGNDYDNKEVIRLVAIPMGDQDGIMEISIGSEVGRQLIGKKVGEPIQLKNGMTVMIESILDLEKEQTR